MTAPTPVKLGPGTMMLGETEDMSCLIQNAVVSWSVDAEDDLNVLCGDTVPGARTYTATLSGTVLEDLDNPTGIVNFTWANKGDAVSFTFIPNTEAGAEVTGTLTVDPLNVGGDEYGQVMTSDFEWSIVGEPVLSWAGEPPVEGFSSSTKSTSSKDTAAA